MAKQTGSLDLRAVKQAYIKTVAKAQPIYKRTNTNSAPSPPTSKISASTDQGTSGNWTTMHMARLCSTNFAYKYLWTCNQLLAPDDTFLGTTDVVADNGTTVINGDEIATGTIAAARLNIADTITAINNNGTTTINGGKITTGTLSASAVNATSGTFNTANIPNLSADKITTGTINIGRIPSGALNSELASDITNAGNTANNYITAIDNNGIQIHAANNSTTNYSQIDADGLNIVKGGTSVASFGDSVRVGKTNYGHIDIDAKGLTVRGNQDGSPLSPTNDYNSYVTSRAVFIGGGGSEVADIDMCGACMNIHANSNSTLNWAQIYTQTQSVYQQPDTATLTLGSVNSSGNWASVEVEATDRTGVDETVIGLQAKSVYANGDFYVKNHSSPIGTIKRGEPSAAVSVPDKTFKALCSVSLEAGTWIVICTVRAPSNATGFRMANLATTAAVNACNACIPAVSANVTQYDFTKIVTPTATTTYYLNVYHNAGTSLIYPTGSTNYITAIRIL